MAEHFEKRIVEFKHTGSQSAGTLWTATEHEIEADEMGEIVYAEVFPPVTSDGTEEVLERWYPVLDGRDYDDYLNLNGTRAPNMAPPELETQGNIVAFGTPMCEAVKKRAPMLEGRCPKFKSKVSVKAWAGSGGISADYLIRLHIYVYKKEELPKIAATVPGLGSITDFARGRTIPVGKGAVALSYDNWDKLPGGLMQAVPKINTFMTWATNNKATTLNQDYEFRVDRENVDPAKPWQNLYFNYEDGNNILIVNGLGSRPADNLAFSALKIAGDHHPKGMIPTRAHNDPISFGKLRPLVDVPQYTAIKKFDRAYIVYNEIGVVVIRDDGSAAVAAGDARVAVSAVRIELT